MNNSNDNQMTTEKVTSNELNIPDNIVEHKELVLGYSSVIPKGASLEYLLNIWEVMYKDISYSTHEVSDFFTKLNIFWDTYGIHYQHLGYVYQTFLSEGMTISFMCRLNARDDAKSFNEVFDGELNNHTILQFHRDDIKGKFFISIIDTDSKQVKVFEIDYEKFKVSYNKRLVDILLNYTLKTYQFNYEKENYFEKNNNNGITYSFLVIQMILENEDVIWHIEDEYC